MYMYTSGARRLLRALLSSSSSYIDWIQARSIRAACASRVPFPCCIRTMVEDKGRPSLTVICSKARKLSDVLRMRGPMCKHRGLITL
jgi:hypothetical protein